MSPFISKAVNSCARDSLFSGLMLTVRLFKREGEEASLQCFTFMVQIGTGQRRCGDVQADFIICGDFGNTTWVCNFYETSISPANTQAGALPADHSLL